ncbi:MAG: AMP-binding protein [Actinomycetota bacterium]|nr:AMP-binding protein [Actinomycetota bacterium]
MAELPTAGHRPRPVAAHPDPSPDLLRDPPGDLPDLLGRLVRRDPHAVVLVDRSPDGASLPVRRGELAARVRSLAAELAVAGVGPDGCVAVWLPNWSDTVVWQLAAAARGAHVVGLNTRYNVEEVAHVLRRARPAVLALAVGFHGLDLLGTLRGAVAAAPKVPVPVVAPVTGPGRPAVDDPSRVDVGGGAWAPGPVDAAAPEPPRGDPERLVAAFTTSGSTGRPKLAAHTGAAVLAHAAAAATALGIEDGDAVLCALPLSGVFGFNTAMATLAAGGVCVLEPVFDAEAVLDDLAAHRVTHVVGGDDLVLRLHDAWTARPRALPHWRWLGIADFQRRARELAAWAEVTFGTVATGLYGSSEVFALTSCWPAAEPAPSRWDAGGRVVLAQTAVRVADPSSGEVLPSGTEGELQFRGPTVVDTYLGAPDVADTVFTADGWFRSGDLGVLVDDGAFVYVCRAGDALRLRGFLVDPAEIELRLAAHPGVSAAKVVGVEGPDGATRAVAFVVPREGEAVGELQEWCAAGLARFKVPEAVHLVPGLPMTDGPNGLKVRTATLREWAAERHGGHPAEP